MPTIDSIKQLMMLMNDYNIIEVCYEGITLKRAPKLEITKTYEPKEDRPSYKSKLPLSVNDIADDDPGFLSFTGRS